MPSSLAMEAPFLPCSLRRTTRWNCSSTSSMVGAWSALCPRAPAASEAAWAFRKRAMPSGTRPRARAVWASCRRGLQAERLAVPSRAESRTADGRFTGPRWKNTRLLSWAMLTRERLWRCIGGAGWRGLPWALAGCCLLPWLLPEGWEGRFGVGLHVLGWGLAAAGLPLVAFRRLRALGLALVLGWITLLGLAREARWERALPRDLTELSGSLAEPWRVRGERRLGTLALQEPAA